MYWRKYKTKLSNDHCHAMVRLIEYVIVNQSCEDMEGKLHLAALAEVAQHLKAKLVNYQREYKCTFSPAQAIAVQILLLNDVLPQVTKLGDFENRMLMLSSSIHQTYESIRSVKQLSN